jgi:hypothetical protein
MVIDRKSEVVEKIPIEKSEMRMGSTSTPPPTPQSCSYVVGKVKHFTFSPPVAFDTKILIFCFFQSHRM